jgi:hypothetical protein
MVQSELNYTFAVFLYAYLKNWFIRTYFYSKCVFLSANLVFEVQNSGTYRPRITRPTCIIQIKVHDEILDKFKDKMSFKGLPPVLTY